MPPTLLLWDIDGTLIDSGGAGEHGIIAALRDEFGIETDLAWLNYFGRTDRWIFRTLLEHYGLPVDPVHLARLRAAYLRHLRLAVDNPRARCLPGASTLVDAWAKRPSAAQGLLTGNLAEGAEVKLRHLGLWSRLPFGAFAEVSEDRNELGPVALAQAEAHTGWSFDRRRVWVLGDTPHDILCGQALGARTLAVATGRYTLAQLSPYQPDVLVNDLSETQRLLDLLSA